MIFTIAIIVLVVAAVPLSFERYLTVLGALVLVVVCVEEHR